MDQFLAGVALGMFLMAVKEIPTIAFNRPFVLRRILLRMLEDLASIGFIAMLIGGGSALNRAAGTCKAVPLCFQDHPDVSWILVISGIAMIVLPVALIQYTRFLESVRRDEETYSRQQRAGDEPKVIRYLPRRPVRRRR